MEGRIISWSPKPEGVQKIVQKVPNQRKPATHLPAIGRPTTITPAAQLLTGKNDAVVHDGAADDAAHDVASYAAAAANDVTAYDAAAAT